MWIPSADDDNVPRPDRSTRHAFVENSALPPSKRHKSREDHPGTSSKDNAPRSGGHRGRDRSRDPKISLEELTYNMARLLIRHEDSIQTLKQNSAFMLYLKTSSALLPMLYKVSKRWKEEREQVIKIDLPLRSVLLTCLLQDLLRRVTRVQQLLHIGAGHDDYKKAQDEIAIYLQDEIIDGSGNFLAKAWDGKQLKIVPGKLPVAEACTLLQRLAAAITDPEIIQRFHSMRPLGPSFSGVVLPFFLEIGWRQQDAAATWTDLNTITQFTMLGVAAGAVETNLASDIQKQLSALTRRT